MFMYEPGFKCTVEYRGSCSAQQAANHEDPETVEMFRDTGQAIKDSVQDTIEASATERQETEYSSVFRENRCLPPPKPVYGGNFSHEAVTLKIRSRSPNLISY